MLGPGQNVRGLRLLSLVGGPCTFRRFRETRLCPLLRRFMLLPLWERALSSDPIQRVHGCEVEAQGEDTYGIDELDTTALSQVIIQWLHGYRFYVYKNNRHPSHVPSFYPYSD